MSTPAFLPNAMISRGRQQIDRRFGERVPRQCSGSDWRHLVAARAVGNGVEVYSDNQDENLATIRMRESPPLALGGRAYARPSKARGGEADGPAG